MAGRFGAILSSLSIAAGQSVRRNAADDGFEVYTPYLGWATGIIAMWSGSIASIPTGYVLCNGANGTPDLRDKFIVGAKQDDVGVAKTCITGSLTQSGAPSHCHSVDSHIHNFSGSGYTCSCGCYFNAAYDGASYSYVQCCGHVHSYCFSGYTDSCNPNTSCASVIPSYFALAYIMKT